MRGRRPSLKYAAETNTAVEAKAQLTFGNGAGHESTELLTAVINGRKVELQGALSGPDMLLPGNYRARLVSETHESVYELRQQWEILLPGDRTRKFDLVGIRE